MKTLEQTHDVWGIWESVTDNVRNKKGKLTYPNKYRGVGEKG